MSSTRKRLFPDTVLLISNCSLCICDSRSCLVFYSPKHNVSQRTATDDSSQPVLILSCAFTPFLSSYLSFLSFFQGVNSIFNSKKLVVKPVTDTDLLVKVGIVVALQCVLCGVYSGMPLSTSILEVGKGSLSGKLVHSCSNESGFDAWLGVEVSFLGVLMIIAAFMAFATRNLPRYDPTSSIEGVVYACTYRCTCFIPLFALLLFPCNSAFNESTHIMHTLLLMVCYLILIVPLAILQDDSPSGSIIIQGIGQSFLSLLIFLMVFGKRTYITSDADVSGMLPLNWRLTRISSPRDWCTYSVLCTAPKLFIIAIGKENDKTMLETKSILDMTRNQRKPAHSSGTGISNTASAESHTSTGSHDAGATAVVTKEKPLSVNLMTKADHQKIVADLTAKIASLQSQLGIIASSPTAPATSPVPDSASVDEETFTSDEQVVVLHADPNA